MWRGFVNTVEIMQCCHWFRSTASAFFPVDFRRSLASSSSHCHDMFQVMSRGDIITAGLIIDKAEVLERMQPEEDGEDMESEEHMEERNATQAAFHEQVPHTINISIDVGERTHFLHTHIGTKS